MEWLSLVSCLYLLFFKVLDCVMEAGCRPEIEGYSWGYPKKTTILILLLVLLLLVVLVVVIFITVHLVCNTNHFQDPPSYLQYSFLDTFSLADTFS